MRMRMVEAALITSSLSALFSFLIFAWCWIFWFGFWWPMSLVSSADWAASFFLASASAFLCAEAAAVAVAAASRAAPASSCATAS